MIEDRITMKHIPDGYQELAKLIGIKSFLMLCKRYGGAPVYFPKFDTLSRPVRDEVICEEYNGQNHFELAHKYGLSQAQIRKVVQRKTLL